MRPRPLTATLLLALLAGTALAGCGGLGEDFDPGLKPGAEGITAVIQSYARGIAHGDPNQACGLLSTTAQDELLQRTGVNGSCLDAARTISDALSEDAKAALADVQVEDIRGGSTTSATATMSGVGAQEAAAALGGATISLVVEELRWGIDSVQP